MSARRKILYAAGALVLAVIFGAAGGWSAHRRPSITAEERQLLGQPPLPYSVSIVEWDAAARAKTSQNPEAYARRLADVVIPSPGGLMTSDSAAVADTEALSVTFNVKLLDPALSGVPEIVPPAERLNPEGSDPLATDHA